MGKFVWFSVSSFLGLGFCFGNIQVLKRKDLNSEELRQRTMKFAIQAISFTRLLPHGVDGQVLGKQLLRSATSVAANYRAAGRARSRAEFISKLSIVVEEADETLFWLELIQASNMCQSTELMKEATELLYIFSSSRKTAKENHQITKSLNNPPGWWNW